jgi:flagellar motor protein MotB
VQDTEDGELMGAGVDLAMSLSGVLVIVVFFALAQFWASSARQARSREPVNSEVTRLRGQVSEIAKRLDEEKKNADKVRADLASSQATSGGRQAQTAKDAKAISDANAARETAEAKVKVVERYNENLASQVGALQRQLSEANAARESAEAKTKAVQEHHESLASQIGVLQRQLSDANAARETAETRVKAVQEHNDKLTAQVSAMQQRSSDKPPLIVISDEKFRTFEEGSAELSEDLKGYLRSNVGRIYALRKDYRADVIEVIGHTDEVRIGSSMRQACNLDDNLLDVLNGQQEPRTLEPCDNVGLGMARATAVVSELKQLGLQKDFAILPLSAGPAIDLGGSLASGRQYGVAIPARRRIEIRLRRTGE